MVDEWCAVKSFGSKGQLNYHIKKSHDWTGKKCELPDCPKADVVWSDGFNYADIQGHCWIVDLLLAFVDWVPGYLLTGYIA